MYKLATKSIILLVIEVGIDINFTTLKLIESRGLNISISGSVLFVTVVFAVSLER